MVFLTQRRTRRGHTETQILAALREAEGGTTEVDVCRQVGISEQTVSCGRQVCGAEPQ
jgi:predicted transcriptional regulator